MSEEWECIIRDKDGSCTVSIPKKKGAVLKIQCREKADMDKWVEVVKRFADPTEKKRIVLEPLESEPKVAYHTSKLPKTEEKT